MIWTLSSWRSSWKRLLPGSLSALGVLLLLKFGFLAPLEQLSYQALFQMRGQQPWSSELVLINIDDASLAQLGRFPWSRQRYIELLKLLTPVESNLVVFDLLFSESSPDDAQLGAAMAQLGQVILVQAWNSTGAVLQPVPTLARNALGVGHILTQQDSDGIVRQVAPQLNGVPMLAVVVAQARSLTQAEVRLPSMTQPFWVSWVGQTSRLTQYSFVDVLAGKVDPERFANKIVLVGVTATGLDPLTTPFDRNPPTSSVILHATLIDNLLCQHHLQPWSSRELLLLFLLGGPLLGWLLSGQGWLRQLLAVAGLWAGWLLLSVLLLNAAWLLPIVPPLTLFMLTGGATGLYDRLREAARLRRQIQSLEANQVLKEEFLRTASHELRTPMANMQSAITLLKMTDSPQDRNEYLQILEDEVQQEFALINDLLDLQRLSNQKPIQLQTQDLKDWLLEVVLPFQLRAETNQQHLDLLVLGQNQTLTLDWGSLRRITTELLHNACKYTPAQGFIQIRAEVQQELRLEISNSGVLLPADELDKLFQPFYRNVEVDYRQQGGTGLGLAIVKRLVEHLNGEVQVQIQNQMLTFTICLPLTLSAVLEPP
ncbi:MAG: CHASE2 domain-containing protein [Elainella sp.]